MGMPWLLQRYIFREMARTFLLAAAAMTAVLSLGGGIHQMIRLGEVTPAQLLHLLELMVPVALALTLPVAALFAASSTYSRLAADNEFVACRASGINLLVLLLPTLVLSLIASLASFVFFSFVIPGMVRNLNHFVARDVVTFIQKALSRPKGIRIGDSYNVCADEVLSDPADPRRIALRRVAFVENHEGQWTRYGTARQVVLEFDNSGSQVQVAGQMTGLTFFDRVAGRFGTTEEQSVPANTLPTMLPQELKYLTLGELIDYWRRPDAWREVAAAQNRVRIALARRRLFDDALTTLGPGGGGHLEWRDESMTLTIRAQRASRIPRDGGVELHDVSIEELRGSYRRACRAARATIDTPRAGSLEEVELQVDVYDAKVSREGQTVERTREVFGPVAAPRALIEEVAALPPEALLRGGAASDEGDPLAARRGEAVAMRERVLRRIASTINERAAFSLSIFGLVILGAALGMVLRNAHLVVIFGISFLPSVLVIVTIVMGKQLAQGASSHAAGMVLMWSGIIAVALLDAWTLLRVVRR